MKQLLALLFFLIGWNLQASESFHLIRKNVGASVYYQGKEPVVKTAIKLLIQDSKSVCLHPFTHTETVIDHSIVVGVLGQDQEFQKLLLKYKIDCSVIQGQWEAFQIQSVTANGEVYLFVIGSDPRGVAYGVLELSRLIGVSPWVWWADVSPIQKSEVALPVHYKNIQSPSVQYRGIFLNDEDWGLLPWSSKTFETNLPLVGKTKGTVGHKTYARIFELLLRLRANTIWPAMHETTVPFYFVEGNKEMAAQYGIVVGASHCEPLMRNSATEWDIAGVGDYNYVTNREGMLSYWTERLQELNGSENIYTIGLRGKHDGMMQGVKTLEEHKSVLSQVLKDQRELLRKYVNPNPNKIPQTFIPYKEVLDVYDDGLEVPDDVTLVWCDDNYGYIRRLSNEKERLRAGGSGVYYHVSYWGRPHDYLWLASTSPALLHTEMKRAYEHDATKLWILNVGDIKPAEYLTEFFLDMAWDIHLSKEQSVFKHLEQWSAREFGKPHAEEITAIMKEYYRLANFRKPEHTGWSRVEETGYPRNLMPIMDSEYNPAFHDELQNRLRDYSAIEEQVKRLSVAMPENKKIAFFQLVEYPVRGASLINKKWLYAQLRKMEESVQAYDEIERITEEYSHLENGKWNRIMSSHPRDLPVFAKPEFSKTAEHPQAKYKGFVAAQNAGQAVNIKNGGVEGLGHSFAAVPLAQYDSLIFVFDAPADGAGWIKIAAIPNHDVDGQGMKIAVTVDGQTLSTADYRVEGRSETWKQQVLRGQSLITFPFNFQHKGKTTVSVKALTPHIIIDQIMVGNGEMNFYEFPTNKINYGTSSI
ncbi:MAG: hypothetical protein EZS26_002969 [Candidatus Ordinivivax streblomastigis]|uniref:Gylcosyl hydrolase 115 C-terminal domain-containing protein n=1 Tax=Candidatus Ordinivivax streblomastigis TaxID=2540710 RepID=A0A5M8NYJ9_9BACT|nr:MAG: hypothetical protein EZS26_002969 [Candidatus Ordinivivax streblomastigis]